MSTIKVGTESATDSVSKSASASRSGSRSAVTSPPTNDIGEGQELPGASGSGKEPADVDRNTDSPGPPSQSKSEMKGNTHNQHSTPQPGYYSYHQQQVTPEPPSPTTPSGGYDIAGFLQQQAALAQQQAAAGNPFGVNQQYSTGISHPPLSPGQSSTNNSAHSISMGVVPPASPLFPGTAAGAYPGSTLEHQQHLDSAAGLSRMSSSSGAAAPPSPPLPYLSSPPLGPVASANYSIYAGYAGPGSSYGNLNSRGSAPSSPEQPTWSERTMQMPHHLYQQTTHSPSPQLQPQGIPMPYPASFVRSNRSYSFDEMLPPSAFEQQDQSTAGYSPYASSLSTASAAGGATLFAHQQPWGYSGVSDVYAGTHTTAQQRHPPGHYMQSHIGLGHSVGVARHPGRHMGHPQHGQPYYPATTPGPPIQTTASNKGPDGANLFIFHIPNHFTNLDMYHLFCHYGNLLSVRIMVEKDTGRSRGFGFVSYDSPEAAAMAIKELNGFVIGNKRLKVQHKQIRASDQPTTQQHQPYLQTTSYGTSSAGNGGFIHSDIGTSDASSGSKWYDEPKSGDAISGGTETNHGITGNAAGSEGEQVFSELTGGSNDMPRNVSATTANPCGETLGLPDENSKGVSNSSENVLSRSGGVGILDESAGLTPKPAANARIGVSGSSATSPLANMDSIRSSLPDVSE